jgi:hypothetical protein
MAKTTRNNRMATVAAHPRAGTRDLRAARMIHRSKGEAVWGGRSMSGKSPPTAAPTRSGPASPTRPVKEARKTPLVVAR